MFRKITLLLLPFIVITFFIRELLFTISNPSWGDMVAIPPQPLPFGEALFHVWRDIFTGGFGPTNIPHLLLSQLSYVVNPSLLEGVYLFFIFPLLFICFLDILKNLLKKNSFLDIEILIEANLLTLIIFFSNTFLVNFIQGNPDVYYAYLIGIPAILYLFLFIRDRDLISGLKMVLLITVANLFGTLSIIYLALLLFPFFLLFSFIYWKKISFAALSLVLFLIITNNAALLFAALKPILDAVSSVGGGGGKAIIDSSFSLYKGFNPLELFYFAGNYGDVTWLLFNIPGGFLYRSHGLYSLGVLQTVIILFLLVKAVRSTSELNQRRLIIGVFAIYLLFFLLLLVWGTNSFESIAKHIPLTSLFRNPKKIVLSLYVSMIVAMVIIRPFLRHRTYRNGFLAILFLSLITVFPLINDGFIGLKNAQTVSSDFYFRNQEQTPRRFDQLINYPTRFITLKKILEKEDGGDKNVNYREVILPDNSQTLYQGQLFYLLNPFYINVNAAVYGQLQDPGSMMTALYSSLIEKNASTSSQLLNIANVKYLIIDRKSPYDLYLTNKTPQIRNYYGIFTSGDPEEFKKIIDQLGFLKRSVTTDDFYIYRNQNYQNTLVYSPQNICPAEQLIKQMMRCDFYSNTTFPSTKRPELIISGIKRESPTKYSFTVQGKSSGKAIIFLNQSFDKSWSLQETSAKDIHVSNHRIGNFFGNTWTIDIPQKGKYSFDITYDLQTPYVWLLILSFLSILSTVGLIGILSFKK